ncbi:MAG: LysR family transcriptional regulator [Deltaproteobacteria bacterium]|nr:LysR family transcriptional regulator [Deltaproteobacteria bacterium]
MNQTNLSNFDLNLLVIFDAIYREKNLTRAGQRLNLTQSAISHALNRLRSAFDDRLFIRHGHQMAPTSLADELNRNITQIIELAGRTLGERGAFNPERSQHRFNIGIQDYPMLVVLPKIMEAIKSMAPKISFRIYNFNMEARKIALEDGKVELVVGIKQPFNSNIYQQYLFEDKHVCILRKDHPHIGETLTLKQYLAAEHIALAVSDYGEEMIDKVLKKIGHHRNIRYTVEQETAIPRLVSTTDYLANVAESVAKEYIKWLPIKILPVPEMQHQFQTYQFWHIRHHMDPAHEWLRKTLKTVCEKLP